MRLLRETPSIDSQSTWPEARQEIDRDPRFEAVGDEAKREEWFNEYVQGLVCNHCFHLLSFIGNISWLMQLGCKWTTWRNWN